MTTWLNTLLTGSPYDGPYGSMWGHDWSHKFYKNACPSWTWTFWTKGPGMSNRLFEKVEVIAAGTCHINFVEVEGEQHQHLEREHLRCLDKQRREPSSWRKMLLCGSPELFCLHALQFNWLLGLPSSVRQALTAIWSPLPSILLRNLSETAEEDHNC